MGDCCTKGLDVNYDTAVWAKLDSTEVDDCLDEMYYYLHSSDKKSYKRKADQTLDGKNSLEITCFSWFKE